MLAEHSDYSLDYERGKKMLAKDGDYSLDYGRGKKWISRCDMVKEKSVDAGQAIYSKKVLLIYDLWVLGFSNAFLWKCPTALLRSEFTKNATRNHLDVGVGTGYYPDKCLSDTDRRLALLDMNSNSLEIAASRVRRFKPEIYRTNVLDKLNLPCDKFDSVSLNYVLHCLPGSLREKSSLFNNILPYLNEKAVVFGSTILNDDIEIGVLAKKLMSIYNKKGIFDNLGDNVAELSSSLRKYFNDVDIRVVGCVAVFTAKYPIRHEV